MKKNQYEDEEQHQRPQSASSTFEYRSLSNGLGDTGRDSQLGDKLQLSHTKHDLTNFRQFKSRTAIFGARDSVDNFMSQLDDAIQRCNSQNYTEMKKSLCNICSSNLISSGENSEQHSRAASRDSQITLTSWEPRIQYGKTNTEQLRDKIYQLEHNKRKQYEKQQEIQRALSAKNQRFFQQQLNEKYHEKVKLINARSSQCNQHLEAFQRLQIQRDLNAQKKVQSAYARSRKQLQAQQDSFHKLAEIAQQKSQKAIENKQKMEESYMRDTLRSLQKSQQNTEKLIQLQKIQQYANSQIKSQQYRKNIENTQRLKEDDYKKRIKFEQQLIGKQKRVENFMAQKPQSRQFNPSTPIVVNLSQNDKTNRLQQLVNQKVRKLDFDPPRISPSSANPLKESMNFKQNYCQQPNVQIYKRNELDMRQEQKYQNRLWQSKRLDDSIMNSQRLK